MDKADLHSAGRIRRPGNQVVSRSIHPEDGGYKNDGTITAVERKAIATAGAHVEHSALETLVAVGKGNPLYRLNSKAELAAVYTNEVFCGAMRGYGNPEDTFLREQS